MPRRKKRKSSKKKKRKKERTSWFTALRPETRRGVAVIVFATLGILSVLAFYGYAGRIGGVVDMLANRLFGRATVLVPIALFVIAGVLLRFIHKSVYASAIIGTAVLVLSVVGLLHVVFPESQQGGLLGVAVGAPLLYGVGQIATMVVLMAAFVVALLITFNIPLRSVTVERGTDDASVPVSENEKAAQEQRRKRGLLGRMASLWRRRDKQVAAEDAFAVTTAVSEEVNTGDDTVTAPSTLESSTTVNKMDTTAKGFTAAPQRSSTSYTPPAVSLLEKGGGKPSTGDIKANSTIIRRTLQNFGIDVEMGEVNVGPTVTQYTLRPATGVKLAKILSLQKDLSLALAAHPIRIEAPIPGRSLVGVEVPNTSVATVRLRTLFEDESAKAARRKYHIPLAIGRDVAGNPVWTDLARMPHLLVAGATGSGKSVAINALLINILYQFSPEHLRLILIDPKRVELPLYNGIPHLLSPVIVSAEKVPNALRWAIEEMEERYEHLAEVGARDIASYNNQIDRRSHAPLPYIVIVVDELADIMASYGREVEGAIVRLAQMARAVGIHLIVSTQRPSVEVITGLIKANITSRVAFQVASQVDSRTILDQAGSEKLLGNGDMLFLSGEAAHPRRIQGALITEQEVKNVVNALKVSEEEMAYEDEVTASSPSGPAGVEDLEDDRYEEAKQLVIEVGQASASFLQRRMKVGYARAARLIDMLEQGGIVGPQQGSKPREVLVDYEVEEEKEI